MTAHLIKSDYYSRTFIGETSDKPSSPERVGDIFIDLKTDKKYVGFANSWHEVTCF